MSSPTIPVIDLRDAEERRAEIVSSLRSAYTEVGFAYLEGHGVDPALVESAFAASQHFHALPVEEKLALRVNEWHRGYLPFAESTIVASTIERATKPNRSESLMVMHEVEPDDPARVGDPLAGPNQWPELPGFREAIEAYERAVREVAVQLVSLFEEVLGADRGQLTGRFAAPTTFLRLLHYPPQEPDADDGFGSAPHTDYGFVTILAQDDTGGLQVRTPDGADWIEAPPRPGAFVLNLGDVGARWSNDRLRSTPHRVLNRTTEDRYSIPYFFDPAASADLAPLGCCVGPEGPRYEAVSYGDYLMGKLNANHSYRKR